MQKLAAGGACEAYPLAQPSAANGWVGVRLYIDEETWGDTGRSGEIWGDMGRVRLYVDEAGARNAMHTTRTPHPHHTHTTPTPHAHHTHTTRTRTPHTALPRAPGLAL